MSKFFARFRKDEKGATAIEYGLIAALISVALIGGAAVVGGKVEKTFDDIGTSFNTERTAAQ